MESGDLIHAANLDMLNAYPWQSVLTFLLTDVFTHREVRLVIFILSS
jgi:hypothetical protein